MLAEKDLTAMYSDVVKTAQALRDARGSLTRAIREIGVLRDIDQFTAREACTVLAALRLFEVVQRQGGKLPHGMRRSLNCPDPTPITRVTDMEHFETETPLSAEEVDDLCERIEVDFNR